MNDQDVARQVALIADGRLHAEMARNLSRAAADIEGSGNLSCAEALRVQSRTHRIRSLERMAQARAITAVGDTDAFPG